MNRDGDAAGGSVDGDSTERGSDDRSADGGEPRDGDEEANVEGSEERGPPVGAETVVIAVSTLFTAALFGYVLWQATLGTTAVAPEAHVVGTTPLPDGDVRVEVAVENDRNVGVAAVTVAVHCTSPPTQMTFEHVPVDGRRTGFVVCPPGSGTPEATVTGWMDA